MNIIIIMIFSWFVYHFLCVTGFILCFCKPWSAREFSPNKKPWICLWRFIWRIDGKAAYSAGSLGGQAPLMPRVYSPPKIGKSDFAEHQTRGIFFGIGEKIICWVFWDSHKITWAAWHLLMFRFFVFFFGSFFLGGCKFWLLGPPALISIGGKSLYSLLASTLPIKLHQCLSTCEALLRRMCPRLGPQFPKEHVGLVLVYLRSWGVL